MKRFQECSKVEKLWRYRWYIPLPFKFVYYSLFKPFKVYHCESDKYDVLKGNRLWKLLIGDAQSSMKWYYDYNEVMNEFKLKKYGKRIERK